MATTRNAERADPRVRYVAHFENDGPAAARAAAVAARAGWAQREATDDLRCGQWRARYQAGLAAASATEFRYHRYLAAGGEYAQALEAEAGS